MTTFFTCACDEFPSVIVISKDDTSALDLIATALVGAGYPDFRTRCGFTPEVHELDEFAVVGEPS